MSAEPDEKPKLTLNISLNDGPCTTSSWMSWNEVDLAFLLAIQVKVKPSTNFKKVFAAATVRRESLHLPRRELTGHPEKFSKGSRCVTTSSVHAHDQALRSLGTLRFTYEGQRLREEDTPATVISRVHDERTHSHL